MRELPVHLERVKCNHPVSTVSPAFFPASMPPLRYARCWRGPHPCGCDCHQFVSPSTTPRRTRAPSVRSKPTSAQRCPAGLQAFVRRFRDKGACSAPAGCVPGAFAVCTKIDQKNIRPPRTSIPSRALRPTLFGRDRPMQGRQCMFSLSNHVPHQSQIGQLHIAHHSIYSSTERTCSPD